MRTKEHSTSTLLYLLTIFHIPPFTEYHSKVGKDIDGADDDCDNGFVDGYNDNSLDGANNENKELGLIYTLQKTYIFAIGMKMLPI